MCACPVVSREMLVHLRKNYPIGTPIKTENGIRATVISVDNVGTLHAKADNGIILVLVYGIDKYEKIERRN